MPLRLTGEDYSLVQGLDAGGWVQQITRNSSAPALTVDQQGTGPILELQDNGAVIATFKDGGDLDLTGNLVMDKAAYWDAGAAINAARYEIGRNNDATNRLQYNVPAGAQHELSVNDVTVGRFTDAALILDSAIQLRMQDSVRYETGVNLTAGQYEIGRNLSSPNRLQHNVPTGAMHWFTINGASVAGMDGNGFFVDDATADSLYTKGGLKVDGAINHDGSTVGLYGVAPVAQAAKINDPSGGTTIDTEARTAINTVIDALEGIGITASV